MNLESFAPGYNPEPQEQPNANNPNRKSGFRLISAGCVVVLFLFGLFQFALPADGSEVRLVPEANQITGTVTDPDGATPPAGSHVLLFDSEETFKGLSQLDGEGKFAFTSNLANGHYIVIAIPADGSEFTNSQPKVVPLVGTSADAGTLALTHPDLIGTVFEPDGTTPIEARIHIAQDNHTFYNEVAPDGEIRIGGLFSGTYQIKAVPLAGDPFWHSVEQTITVTTGISQSLDLVLQPANVTGQAVDVTDSPIPFASVFVWGQSTFTFRWALASHEGKFAIGDLPDDSYVLVVHPPFYADSLGKSDEVLFDVPPETNELGKITLPNAPKTVVGQVKTNTGQPVDNAVIVAHRVGIPAGQEAETNVDGLYTLNLTAGIWALTVRPAPDSDSATDINWIYPEAPNWSILTMTNRTKVRTLTLKY